MISKTKELRPAGSAKGTEPPWSGLRLRALVLAAGLGTRLRPLTEQIPKPLLPVLGRSVLEHTLGHLADIGCEATAINLHHLGDQIRSTLGSFFGAMPLTYSEEAEPLGTLGAFPPLREFFAPADLILLINGDSLCRWPLERLLRRHLRGDSAATLLLASRPDPAAFGGGVAIDREGAILGFRRSDPLPRPAARRCVFAGAHVFRPALLAETRSGFSNIVRDRYSPLVAAGERLQGVVTGQPWHDLGTPRRYLQAVLEWGRASKQSSQGVLYRGAEVILAPSARIEGAVFEDGAEVEAETSVERSVVLAGTRIGRGSRLREALIGPAVVLPPGSIVERSLIVATPPGADGPSWTRTPFDPT